jgi:ribosomal protein S18 acetylase RimI-like enzyme
LNIEILQTSIETAWEVSLLIPELVNPHPANEYHHRMDGKTSLCLVAYLEGRPAGFKVGYDKFGDGSFYTWMGGVVPAYRRNHIAKALADAQEAWAAMQGFNSIILKTRNRHQAMLIFALSNGFSITGVEPMETLEEYRIVLKKKISV